MENPTPITKSGTGVLGTIIGTLVLFGVVTLCVLI